MSMTMVNQRGASAPAAACAAATEALARCASSCLGSGPSVGASDIAPSTVAACAEWCVAGARTLGACADLIGLGGAERAPLVIAVARAGIVAADACEAECAGVATASEPWSDAAEAAVAAAAAAACGEAARQLRQLLAELEPETTTPAAAAR